MQFIKNGPDIPDALLHAHEEGNIVFFCGAGISAPAGLPLFRGLVDRVYLTLGIEPTSIEKATYDSGQYDITLNLLEDRHVGKGKAVRGTLSKILKPNFRYKHSTETHRALLRLANTRDNKTRLITTNYDHIFHHVIKKDKLKVTEYAAPMLPNPKRSRWDSLVYLHGFLPIGETNDGLEHLVLTSGDFGLAYLTERWAARFVSELFRTYSVCFVGYQIGDPVLRYMMDALAADKQRGEPTPPAYAFGPLKVGQDQEEEKSKWISKGVTPILYKVLPQGQKRPEDHSYLHRTLQAWATTYCDGARGNERIVLDLAASRPSKSTQEDDYVGRILWALSDATGLPAKRFSEFDPAPSLDWLEAFSDDRFGHVEMPRFGVLPKTPRDAKVKFSMLRRPSQIERASKMELVHFNYPESAWDPVMFHLAQWLLRHLNDPKLVLWLAQQGGQLHERLAWGIEAQLDKLAQLKRDEKEEELASIRLNAPNAIPDKSMLKLWNMLLTGQVKSSGRDLSLYGWKRRFKREGFTRAIRLELKELLTPKVLLSKPFQWGAESTQKSPPKTLNQRVKCELVLAGDDIYDCLNQMEGGEAWEDGLPSLLDDLQLLLRDALDLRREIEKADDQIDLSYMALPSISAHWQNRGFRDWVALIELLRDAWVATWKRDQPKAARIAHNWFTLPYSTFKRLALFAATHDGVASRGEWVEWVLADDGKWLWSAETKREVMRLLIQVGDSLAEDPRNRLEEAIVNGPPRQLFRDDLDAERLHEVTSHYTWLRLKALNAEGSFIREIATRKLKELEAADNHLQRDIVEQDEFSSWTSGTGDPDYEEQRIFERAPRKHSELVQWLLREQDRDQYTEDNWSEFCRRHFATAACALYMLSREGRWPAMRWRQALQAWSVEEKLIRQSWCHLAPVLQAMPEDTLLKIADSAAWWLEAAAKASDQHKDILHSLCCRILTLKYQDPAIVETDEFRAFGHPIGLVTQAFLSRWYRDNPKDNQDLPPDLKPVFTGLCDTRVNEFRNARAILAANIIALFRVDQAWAEKNLLPLFSWKKSTVEARVAWQAFLRTPRLYYPLTAALKAEFLDTVRHYQELGQLGGQYVDFLTFVALDRTVMRMETFTDKELAKATGALSPEGLKMATQTLVRSLKNAGDQAPQHWHNRILPYLQHVWPKSDMHVSFADKFARLAIAAGEAFPSAIEAVDMWLEPVEHPDLIVHVLHESKLCGRFPQDALTLLAKVITDQQRTPSDLRACLDAIVASWPDAAKDRRYQYLDNLTRR